MPIFHSSTAQSIIVGTPYKLFKKIIFKKLKCLHNQQAIRNIICLVRFQILFGYHFSGVLLGRASTDIDKELPVSIGPYSSPMSGRICSGMRSALGIHHQMGKI
jgi:hypothetical protein